MLRMHSRGQCPFRLLLTTEQDRLRDGKERVKGQQDGSTGKKPLPSKPKKLSSSPKKMKRTDSCPHIHT